VLWAPTQAARGQVQVSDRTRLIAWVLACCYAVLWEFLHMVGEPRLGMNSPIPYRFKALLRMGVQMPPLPSIPVRLNALSHLSLLVLFQALMVLSSSGWKRMRDEQCNAAACRPRSPGGSRATSAGCARASQRARCLPWRPGCARSCARTRPTAVPWACPAPATQ
jgi:hypothetical protein